MTQWYVELFDKPKGVMTEVGQVYGYPDFAPARQR